VTNQPLPSDGPPVRVNFVDGQLLTADDLRADQDYHRRMRYLHNRLLHGWGIVDGYHVEDAGRGVLVGPGFAIDSHGRELVLPEHVRIDLPSEAAVDEQTLWYVVATWEEIPSAPVAFSDEIVFSRWIERCALSIRPIPPEDDGQTLLLAALTAAAGNVVSIDTSRWRSQSIPCASC
jgi:hypothetical protein